jgi:hypothetical protein
VNGFKIADAQKFQALSDAVVAEWHRKGWLGQVHFHLASLDRLHDLMLRMPKEAAWSGAVRTRASASDQRFELRNVDVGMGCSTRA